MSLIEFNFHVWADALDPGPRMKRLAAVTMSALMLAASLPAVAEPATEREAVHVLNRLAFGPRPGDIERVSRIGIDRYIDMQLAPSGIPLPDALTNRLANIQVMHETAGETLARFLESRQAAAKGDEEDKRHHRQIARSIVEQTGEAKLVQAIESPRQLQEVMVDFWFNHFNVFIGKNIDAALVASYERDAIRPYALGNFRDLLGATARHPAMLLYLDNWLSASDSYRPGAMQGKAASGPKARANGLNENYARELMELHTLGANSGYTQRDVTELARMLTGWSFAPRELARGNRAFRFDVQRHDWGEKHWLGHAVSAQGQAEGERALDILAMHPATARHISYKLAQYFVRDDPPPALVDRMAGRYLNTRGNIAAVLRELFFSAEFRSPAAMGSKFKTPYRFVVSAARAASLPADDLRPRLGMLARLGMPLYGCRTPDGYKNTEAAWLNPDALMRRIRFASAMAAMRLPVADANAAAQVNQANQGEQGGDAISPELMRDVNAVALLQTLGTGISASTRQTIGEQPERLQAAMIFGSPDFMWH